MSMPVPVPTTTLPSFIRTDARVPDPDDIWKVNLRKRIENDFLHINKNIQILRDAIPSTQPSESSHSRTQRDCETDSIRSLPEGASTRQLFSETSEHRWTLDDIINSNLLDVVRQQPWILDIRKADEERTSPPNASQDDGVIFSTGPRQPAISGQSFDGPSEDGYGSAGAAHESAEADGSKGSAEAGTRLQQSPSVSLTRPLHSKSHISRENTLVFQQHTSTSQLVDGSVDEQRDDSHTRSLRRVPRSSSPSSQAPVLLSNPIQPEHSGLLVPDQRRGSSLAHRDTKRPPVQNHYLIASNIPRGHINPSPWGTSLDTLRSPPSFDDFKDEILPHARQSLVEAECLDVGARHTEASAKIREAAAQKVAEAKHNEEEAKEWEAETRRKLEEARQQELEARQKEEVANRDEEAARKQEEETRRKEEDAKRWEEDTRRRLVDARQREILARQTEEEARRSEEKVRKEEDNRMKEAVARWRREEDELTKGWGKAPPPQGPPRAPPQGKVTRLTPQALGSSRHEPNKELEAVREADDTVRREAARADAANRSAEVESTAPRYRNQPNVQTWGQRTRQRDPAVEERRQKQLENSEQQRLEEQRPVYLEEKIQRCEERHRQERERDEQIRLDEELRREEKVKVTNRPRKDQEERYRILTEQSRNNKVVERSSQRDQPRQQQQWPQKDIPGSHAKDEQKEYGRKVADAYRRTREREPPKNIGAAFGTSVPHQLASPMSARASGRNGVVPKPNSSLPNPRQTVPERYANAPKLAKLAEEKDTDWVEVEGSGVDPSGRKKSVEEEEEEEEEEEQARPTQERIRHQQEQPKPEQQERRRRRHTKNAKVVPKKPEKRSIVSGMISRVLPSTVRPSQKG